MSITMNEDGLPAASDAVRPIKLAGRFWRLVAALIDGLLVTALMLPFYGYQHYWQYFESLTSPPPRVQAIGDVVWFAVFVAINFRLLERRGQTIGKWFIGVAIVGMDGTRKGAVQLLVYRFVPALLFPLVPFVGPPFTVVDTLAIFGRARRCLHDRIAGTQVIDAE